MKFRNYTSSLFLTSKKIVHCLYKYLVLYKFRAVVEFPESVTNAISWLVRFDPFFIEPVLYFDSKSFFSETPYLFCVVRFSSCGNVITCMWRAEFWTSRTVVIEEWRFLFFVLHTINYHGEEQHNIDSFIIVQYCLLPTLKLAYCRPGPRKLVKEVA